MILLQPPATATTSALTVSVTAWMSDAEKAKVTAAAKAAGMSRSAWLRQAALARIP